MLATLEDSSLTNKGIGVRTNLRRSFQKKCTLWQHRLTNGAIGPANSAVVLENVWKLVQCVSPREVWHVETTER